MTEALPREITDVHRTLAYGRHKVNRKFLFMGAVLLALGLLLLQLPRSSFDTYDRVMLVFTFLLGGGMTLYALYRSLFPGKPMLVLSPEGIRLHIEWVKDIVIPWREVRGVDSVDISGRFRGRLVHFPGVTVFLVSRAFYDKYIHVGSWLLRGPGWDSNFIAKDGLVQVALHHEVLPATARELRTAVETRWLAFGQAERKAAGTSGA